MLAELDSIRVEDIENAELDHATHLSLLVASVQDAPMPIEFAGDYSHSQTAVLDQSSAFAQSFAHTSSTTSSETVLTTTQPTTTTPPHGGVPLRRQSSLKSSPSKTKRSGSPRRPSSAVITPGNIANEIFAAPPRLTLDHNNVARLPAFELLQTTSSNPNFSPSQWDGGAVSSPDELLAMHAHQQGDPALFIADTPRSSHDADTIPASQYAQMVGAYNDHARRRLSNVSISSVASIPEDPSTPAPPLSAHLAQQELLSPSVARVSMCSFCTRH